MNCSEAARLNSLLSKVLQELRPPDPPRNGSRSGGGREAGGDEAYLYILLIMIFYACLAGALILAYTRSRKQESKHDPYHLYIERGWNAARSRDGGPEADEPPDREQLLGAALPPTRA
uniref:Potassium voltage-gated channel subfamily E regulatory beta subunit 5 n=1 Tax=Geotrypetes seraphini TaxID=260995 RepID=A0A6P8R1T9_GEOSA|nr:potassium voltage-gated channel subfamily E regulatory beta subunit 5 [Geotrypetes seraphini]XP_033801995.1 potassium voltage-gated channel subfamily E regulatory beta subunit 5 [Geotrypetes seraphini]